MKLEGKFARDLFESDIQSQYDLEEARRVGKCTIERTRIC